MSREPPLLLLAEGRRARPRVAPRPRPRELVLHFAVVDVLHMLGDPAWRWSHFPSGEARNVRTGARLKRMGLKRGWPDFVLVAPGGRFHALELKREGEDLTDDQAAFYVWSVAQGSPIAVARTLDEAIGTLAGWGAIRRIGGAQTPSKKMTEEGAETPSWCHRESSRNVEVVETTLMPSGAPR